VKLHFGIGNYTIAIARLKLGVKLFNLLENIDSSVVLTNPGIIDGERVLLPVVKPSGTCHTYVSLIKCLRVSCFCSVLIVFAAGKKRQGTTDITPYGLKSYIIIANMLGPIEYSDRVVFLESSLRESYNVVFWAVPKRYRIVGCKSNRES